MSPRTWLTFILALFLLISACQPIHPVASPPTPTVAQVAVPATTSSGASDCPNLAAQPLDLIIAPQWKRGDSHRYQASYSQTSVKNSIVGAALISTYSMSVTVLAANKTGYNLDWHTRIFTEAPTKIRLEYSTTPYGEFVKLRNLDELKALTNPFTAQWLLAPGGSLSHTANAVVPAEHLDATEAYATRDIQAYHAIYGLYFTDADSFQYQNEATLPVLDIAGTNNVKISITSYNEAKECLHLNLQSNWQPTSRPANDTITVQTRVNYSLDLKTGWLRTVAIKRTNIINGEGQIEELTLTAVD